MNLFITGTDTDAGKTTVASWICSHISTAYWKPIQTGKDSDAMMVKAFAPQTEIIPETYRLQAPLSAYDAAQKKNIKIDINRLKTSRDKLVIEGAGGVFVPIAEDFFMLNMIEQCHAKALVIARSKLGMINHILLTLYALKQKKIPIVGIVVCGKVEHQIGQTLEHFSGEKILKILPESDNLPQLFKSISIPQTILEILS